MNTISQIIPRFRKFRFPMITALRSVGAIALALCVMSTASAQIVQVSHQSWVNIVSATGNGWMLFPRAIGFDIDSGGTTVKKLLVNWQTQHGCRTISDDARLCGFGQRRRHVGLAIADHDDFARS
ncbi:MAG TPA: hypothetical protein VIO16_01510, partial [Dehalococcoidia bacterium]